LTCPWTGRAKRGSLGICMIWTRHRRAQGAWAQCLGSMEFLRFLFFVLCFFVSLGLDTNYTPTAVVELGISCIWDFIWVLCFSF
jgi:hypothetical protein